MEFAPWIQRADFDTLDLPGSDANTIIDTLLSHDWGAEIDYQRELEGAGKDHCPPGLGVNSLNDDRILHIQPNGNGRCVVDYSFFQVKKLFGVFPQRKYEAGVLENVPIKTTVLFVEPFFRNDFDAIRREVESLK